MKPECAQAIEIAAKKLGLTRVPRIDDIDQKIRDNLKQLVIKDRAAYASRSFDENMQLAGDAALQEAIHKAIVKKRNAELTVESRARIRGVMDSMVSTGLSPAKALTNMTLFDAGADGLRPIDSLIKARVAGYTDKLEAMWKFMDDNTFLHLISTKEGQMKILNELYGIDSGDVGAKKAVASLNKLNDEMGADFNRYGGDLHKLVDWRLPQALNQYRLIKMEKPAFIKEWLALVDRNKYVNPDGTPMSDVQMEKFLGEAYQTMISGTKKGVEPGGRGSTAGKYEGHRQLHYKSPEAYMKAMELAGDGNILSQIYGHISVMSRDIQMMKTWGPNADYEFQRMYDNVWRNADPSEHGMLKTLKTAWDMQTGHYDSGMEPKVQHWVQELKASFVASKLGSMVVSQIADTATIAATARAMNVPMSHVMANASKYATDPNYRQSLRAMGVGMEALANSVARHSDSMSASGPMTKIAGVVVQAQGAQAWNNMWRNSFAAAMGNQISHINATFNDIASLQGKDRTIIEAKGVNDRDWGLWKLAERDPNGTMTQRTINEIPLEQVRQFIPEKVAEIQQQGKALLEKIESQNQKELGWLQGREQKLKDYRAKLESLIADVEKTREKRLEGLTENNLRVIGNLQMRLELAEIDFEIFTKKSQAKTGDRTDRFMESVKRGMEHYGKRRSEIGERLGAIRHSTKLAAYANDAAVDKIGKQLLERYQKLYGMERTEDGLKEIGSVTKAIKEYEAYASKMEERIANSYKKDGTPKKGKEGTADRAERLKEQAKIELEAIKQKADASMEKLRERLGGNEMELEGIRKVIDARRARAENEADIAAYLATERHADRIQGFLDTLEFRGNQVAVRLADEGENLGYRRGLVEARMRAMERQESKYARQAQREVFAKASEFEKRIDKRTKELDEFRSSLQERMDSRQALLDEWDAKYESRINDAALSFREDSALKYRAMLIEEAHMAVLEPSLKSKAEMARFGNGSAIVSLLTQFKTFPWAYMRQHMQQRARSATAGSALGYRAQLAAMGTMAGGTALMLGDLAAGRDPRDVTENPAKFAMSAFFKGGGIGIFNDLIETVTSEFSRDRAARLLGPAVSLFNDLANVASSGARGDTDELAKNLYKVTTQNTPFQNFWVTRAVVHNVLLHELQELANPGYLDRAKQRAEKNYGAGFWISHDGVRAPDFGNIVGQQGATQ